MDRVVRKGRRRNERGLTLVELVVGLALILLVAAIATTSARALADRTAGLAAARHLATRLAASRLTALETGLSAGMQFRDDDGVVRVREVRDGNGNGLRRDEIALGIDLVTTPDESIASRFPGVRFAIVVAGPDIDEEGTIDPGTPPLRIGPSGIVSHSPAGTSSSGTLYVATAGGRQFAVRVLGPTGRVRAYEYLPGDRRWIPR